MKLKVTHSLLYRYSEPVALAPQQILLRPREGHQLSVLRHRLVVEPEARVWWVRDPHENSVAWAGFRERSDELDVRADCEVETRERNPFDFILRPDAARFPFHYLPAETAVLAPYLDKPEGRSHPLLAWMRAVMPQFPDDTLDLLTQLNRVLSEQISYRRRGETTVQKPEETIRRRSGSCRDFAMLMVQACRALGFAARYVSGYLYDPSDQEAAAGSALHAWLEVFLPGAGWKGLDPTHAILTDEHFIPVAVAPGPENLAPVSGAFWGRPGVDSILKTSVTVEAV